MKRPAFQFYAADWRGNAKLRRCTHAERGIWVEVLCLMHDSEEYGVLRWPLRDVALAVSCRLAEIRALAFKEVLKGGDEQIDALVYTPRHAGKNGEPVILLPHQSGPIWYSSRMVRDEYVRSIRGEATRFEPNQEPKPIPKATPKPPIGDGASTSSSSSKKQTPALARFDEFWNLYPRKVASGGAEKAWRKIMHDAPLVETILGVLKKAKWPTDPQFIPHPATWLNRRQWEDETQEAGSRPVFD